MSATIPEPGYSRAAASVMNSPIVLGLPVEQQWALREALGEHASEDTLPPHLKRLFDDAIHPYLAEGEFEEAQHPRDRRGRFVEFLHAMKPNSIERMKGYEVERTREGLWRVRRDRGSATLHDTAESVIRQIDRIEASPAEAASALNPTVLTDALDGFVHGGLRTKVLHASPGLIHGVILAEDGGRVGAFTREIGETGEGVEVFHDSLSLDRGYQDRGFGRAFFEHSVKSYGELGVSKVGVIAGSAVGGYAWASAGFDFDTDRYQVLAHSAARGLAEVRPGLGRDERYARAFAAYDLWKQHRRHLNAAGGDALLGPAGEEARAAFEARFPTLEQLRSYAGGNDEALSNTWSSPQELAIFGREQRWVEAHDPHSLGVEMWLGKRFLLGKTWRGSLELRTEGRLAEMATATKLTLAEITRQVAEERGGVPVPPDSDAMSVEDEQDFWGEVQTRYDAQDGL